MITIIICVKRIVAKLLIKIKTRTGSFFVRPNEENWVIRPSPKKEHLLTKELKALSVQSCLQILLNLSTTSVDKKFCSPLNAAGQFLVVKMKLLYAEGCFFCASVQAPTGPTLIQLILFLWTNAYIFWPPSVWW